MNLEVRTYYVRERNVLVARAEFSSLYAELILHEADWKIDLAPPLEGALRDALALLALHSAARPQNESTAWTIHLQDPMANIFVTADNPAGTLTGTAYDKDVKDAGKNLFYTQSVVPGRDDRTSVTDFAGADLLHALEAFYAQSEQRTARVFRYDQEDLVLLVAQPDCDEDWLTALNQGNILTLDRDAELSLLEIRTFAFACGCSQSRMLDLLTPVMKSDPTGLFGDQETIRIRCPRCGARHLITREALEARSRESPQP